MADEIILEDVAEFGFSYPLGLGKLASFGWFNDETFSPGVDSSYCLAAKNRLIEKFKNKPLLEAVICAWMAQAQELELVLADLWVLRSIDTANGAQLDDVGEIVGLTRQGLDDDEFRLAIKFQIGVNVSNGEAEIIIAQTIQLTGATKVYFLPHYPAGITLNIVLPSVIPDNLQTFIETVCLAGVRLEMAYSDNTAPFVFAGEDGYPGQGGLGYAEKDYPSTVGGNYMEKI